MCDISADERDMATNFLNQRKREIDILVKKNKSFFESISEWSIF